MHIASRVVRRHVPFVMLGLLVLSGIAGCFSLSRDAPPLEQYVLGAGRPPVPAASPDDAAGTRIGVRRLAFAAYLHTPAIVVRQGANRIMVSDFHRWGEDLGEGINRQVARHLAAAGSISAVDIAPWPVRARHDYLVQLHVSRFEGEADSLATAGAARVIASWEIIRPADGAVLARGEADYERRGWRVDDYAALVLMLDDALEDLAGDVLACLARVRVATPSAAANGEPIRALMCVPSGIGRSAAN